MRTYRVYIENKRPGIQYRYERLGDVSARSKKAAIEEAREVFKDQIHAFVSCYGATSAIFVNLLIILKGAPNEH